MKKVWEVIKEIAAVLFVFILILKLSDYFHNANSSYIINLLYKNTGCIAVVIFILEVLISAYDTIYIKLKSQMKKSYTSVVKNLRERFKMSIDNTHDRLSCSLLGQLLVVFYNDEQILNLVLQELKKRYNDDENLKIIISYIFLENDQDDDVVRFFSDNPEDKIEFMAISSKIAMNFVEKWSCHNGYSSVKHDINDILISLRHMCLPQNHIDKDKLIYVCRTLLNMILERLEKLDFVDNGKDISLFLICIPLIQKKISLEKIHNEYLDKKIREIKASEWTSKAVESAYKKIITSLKNDDKTEYDEEEMAYCVSLLSTYFDKLSSFQKLRLYYVIKKINISVSAAYHSYTDDRVILLLVCSSIFSGIEEQKDLLDEAISLAYSCSSGVQSVQSKFMGMKK